MNPADSPPYYVRAEESLTSVGTKVGRRVGPRVGELEGPMVGMLEGRPVGAVEGLARTEQVGELVEDW